MSRLTANATARIALERRKIEARAVITRGRLEADPGCGLLPKMGAVENRLALLQFPKAVELLNEIDDSFEDYRRQKADKEVRAAAAEQDALLEANGTDTARTASGVGQRHGLLWLIHKGRLTGDRRTAGLRWSDDYSLVRTDGIKSSLNDNGQGAPTDAQADRQQEKLANAAARLSRARFHIAASTGSTRLADLLDAVCGRGETLRALAKDDKVRAAMLEVELSIALDMAGVSYDIVKVAA